MASKPNKKKPVGDTETPAAPPVRTAKARPRKEGGGKPLVIVESPAKARTISKILGPGYAVEASIGHVRDLPESAEEIPAEVKKEKWARLGVDVDHDFEPLYIVPARKREQVRKLKQLVAGASALYLATDEDREGESISWHLLEILKPKVPVYRMVFHEITKEAIDQALENPRQIDQDLVRAQETRRIVDRLYGYEVSPLLWKKIRPRLSAGRVQSVAIRLVVERERQRMLFHSSTYWDLLGAFATQAGQGSAAQQFDAELVSVGGKRIASGKDFDPATGQLKADAHVLDAAAAGALAGRLRENPARPQATVESLESRPFVEKPYPPFTTSTLQQEANRKLRFTARRTMEVAQRLYENGLITYMRTDSTNLSAQAISAARELIASRYGAEFLSPAPRLYQTKVKNAQEAHEAIRPAGARFRLPEEVRGEVQEDELRLYDLVWKRAVASQMTDAKGRRMTLSVAAGDARFEARGKTIDFFGYLKAYVEGSDDPEGELADQEKVLPSVQPGNPLEIRDLTPREHKTQPPPRLTEASLVKELESRGIGRPSTYATIIDTILRREYVFKKGNALVPTFTAFAVVGLLEQYLGHLVDYGFTARMEDDLDQISLGEENQQGYLHSFYFGNGQRGLKPLLAEVAALIDPRKVCTIQVQGAGEGVELRIGRYGPFLSSGEKRVGVPDDMPPDELDGAKAMELLAKEVEGPREIGTDPETGQPVFLRTGRFGPYLQLGKAEAGSKKKPKMASLLQGMTPDDVTLETALALLSLPKDLGKHPDTGESVLAASGRFGPYVKSGVQTRSIPEGKSVLTLTLGEALGLLAQPKTEKRRFGKAIQPLKELGKDPKGEPVKLMSGRYGPYVTDGTLNASVPRSENAQALTLERALELLKERAEKGPSKPKPKSRRKLAPRG